MCWKVLNLEILRRKTVFLRRISAKDFCAETLQTARDTAAQTDGLILMKFSTNDLTYICEVHSSRILKFRNQWRHGGHFAGFLGSTLRFTIFVRFLQFLTWSRISSPHVCNLKSEKSEKLVDNFRFLKRTTPKDTYNNAQFMTIWRSGVPSPLGALFQILCVS